MIKSKKRDSIIIIALLLISIAGYFIYSYMIKNKDVSIANVFYRGELIVEVDFNQEEIKVIKEQPNTNQPYPIINEDLYTITILGDYEINGMRQELVIRYDFLKRSMQIIEEESPNNICSKIGESFGAPLICAPNSVRVIFEAGKDLDHEV